MTPPSSPGPGVPPGLSPPRPRFAPTDVHAFYAELLHGEAEMEAALFQREFGAPASSSTPRDVAKYGALVSAFTYPREAPQLPSPVVDSPSPLSRAHLRSVSLAGHSSLNRSPFPAHRSSSGPSLWPEPFRLPISRNVSGTTAASTESLGMRTLEGGKGAHRLAASTSRLSHTTITDPDADVRSETRARRLFILGFIFPLIWVLAARDATEPRARWARRCLAAWMIFCVLCLASVLAVVIALQSKRHDWTL